MALSHELGRRGESLAATYLAARGWFILDRNYRVGHKEIDLIARSGPLVAFTEVKTRAGPDFGHPLESITFSKRREIEIVARTWIARHGSRMDSYRFDAVAITWNGSGAPDIEHVEDAWRL